MSKYFLLGCFLPSLVMAQGRLPQGGGDGHYRVFSSGTSFCTYAFLDIGGTGTPLTFSAPYAQLGDPSPADDGGAVVSLPWAFPYYGQPYLQVVVSPNGYLAFASSLEEEDGRDFSPDYQLPSVPSAYFPSGSPVFGSPQRLYPFHQDLTGEAASVLWQSSSPCPRPSEALGSEPCTVIQWEGIRPLGSAESLRFQAVLYHASGEFVYQYHTVDSSGGGGATVGWQGKGAFWGFAWSARQAGAVSNATALCSFPRDFPPGGPLADLEAELAAGPEELISTSPFPLELAVTNVGPSLAQNVIGSLTLPAGLTLVNDPCGSAAGWAVGNLSPETLATCQVTVEADGSFAGGTVTFSVSSSTNDPQTSNNTASLWLAPGDDGDGVAAAMEESYPGGDGFPRFTKGDGNGDGVPDRQQATVATLPLASGKGWVTVDVTGCSALQQVSTVTEAGSGMTDPQFDFPWGLVRFVVPCPSATVKLLWHFAGMPQPTYRGFGPWQRWKTLAATRVRDRWVWGTLLPLRDGAPGDSQPGDSQLTHLGGPAKPAAFPGRR